MTLVLKLFQTISLNRRASNVRVKEKIQYNFLLVYRLKSKERKFLFTKSLLKMENFIAKDPLNSVKKIR